MGVNHYLHEIVLKTNYLIPNFYENAYEKSLKSYDSIEKHQETIMYYLNEEIRSTTLHQLITDLMRRKEDSWMSKLPQSLRAIVLASPTTVWTYLLGGSSSRYVMLKLLLQCNSVDVITYGLFRVNRMESSSVEEVLSMIWPEVLEDNIIRWISSLDIAYTVYDRYRIAGIKDWNINTIIERAMIRRDGGCVYYGLIAAPFVRPHEWLGLLSTSLKYLLPEDVIMKYLYKLGDYYEKVSINEWDNTLVMLTHVHYEKVAQFLIEVRRRVTWPMIPRRITISSLDFVVYLYSIGQLEGLFKDSTQIENTCADLTPAAVRFLVEIRMITINHLIPICRVFTCINYNTDALDAFLRHPSISNRLTTSRRNIMPTLDTLVSCCLRSGHEYHVAVRIYITSGALIEDPHILITLMMANKPITVLAMCDALLSTQNNLEIIRQAVILNHLPIARKLIKNKIIS